MAIGAAVKQGPFEDAAMCWAIVCAGLAESAARRRGPPLFCDAYLAERPTIPARTVATRHAAAELRGHVGP